MLERQVVVDLCTVSPLMFDVTLRASGQTRGSTPAGQPRRPPAVPPRQ